MEQSTAEVPVAPDRTGAPLFVLVAPSGAGKSTLLAGALEREPRLVRLITATTRAPRVGERDGVDYHFLDEPAFRRLIDDGGFVEWSAHFGALYGLPVAELDRLRGRPGVAVLDINGARSMLTRYAPVVRIFIAPPDIDALRSRLAGRQSEDPEGAAQRLARADLEIAVGATYEHQVVNDDAERAVAQILGIVRAELDRLPQFRS